MTTAVFWPRSSTRNCTPLMINTVRIDGADVKHGRRRAKGGYHPCFISVYLWLVLSAVGPAKASFTAPYQRLKMAAAQRGPTNDRGVDARRIRVDSRETTAAPRAGSRLQPPSCRQRAFTSPTAVEERRCIAEGGIRAPNKTVAAGFSLRGEDAPVKGAATRELVFLGVLSLPPVRRVRAGCGRA